MLVLKKIDLNFSLLSYGQLTTKKFKMIYAQIPEKYLEQKPIEYYLAFVIYTMSIMEGFIEEMAENMHENCKDDGQLMSCASIIQTWNNDCKGLETKFDIFQEEIELNEDMMLHFCRHHPLIIKYRKANTK